MPYKSSRLELRDRVRWYIHMRWFYLVPLAIAGLTPLYIADGWSEDFRRQTMIVVLGVVFNALLLAVVRFGPRRKSVDYVLAIVQIGLDIALASWLIYQNGGIESRSVITYAIPILMTGALLGRRSIYLAAAASAGSYSLISILDYLGAIHPPNVVLPELHDDLLYCIRGILFYTAVFVVLAVITDFVGRLIQDRERLVRRVRTVSAEKAEVEAIIQTMGSALVTTDRQDVITTVNDSFEKLTGWRSSEAIGQPLDEILPIYDQSGHRLKAAKRPMAQLPAAATEVAPARLVSGYSYGRKDGSTFPFMAHISPIVLGGEVLGATSVFEDMTDTRKLDQMKSNFVALVSHQLKTPIGEIRGYVENMLYGVTGKLDPRQEDYLRKINEVTKRSDKLITDLLDITVMEKGSIKLDLRSVRLTDVIQEVLRIYHERLAQTDLKLQVFEEDADIKVRADFNKLVQVLANVMANSISYTKKGAVTIKTKRLDDGQAEICVRDQGRGMNKETLDALFHKDTVLSGAPTAEGGTGLGLYLAKQLVTLMKGEIRVASTSSRGTTICITLPLVKGKG